MKLKRGFSPIPEFANGVVATIGNFDGVHLGHQALINSLRQEVHRLNLPLVVILFEPQPGEYFQGGNAPARLTSLREKLDALKNSRVDYVYCLKFNNELAKMNAEAFAETILFTLLNVKYLSVGQDFRFGRDRAGDIALLTRLALLRHCTVKSFDDFSMNDQRVSSTKIRQYLHAGELEQASGLLGRKFSLCARVVKGDGRGRLWGIPTANLNLQRLNLPLQGVFAVLVKRQGKPMLPAVANIGNRPTVDGSKQVLEVHLLDFNESLYGERLQVFFLHKLRAEIKFTSVEELITQIKHDINAATAYFAASLNLAE